VSTLYRGVGLLNKDYAVSVKFRNGPLVRLMRGKGINTAAELSRATGIAQITIGKCLNLKSPAVGKKGQWLSYTTQLADFFGVLPEDIYPPQHISKGLKVNQVEGEVSFEEMVALSGGENLSYLEEWDGDGVGFSGEGLDMALNSIASRERSIIRDRYGLDGEEPKTLSEIGDKFGVSGTRIAQIEARALRKLRHPSRERKIRGD